MWRQIQHDGLLSTLRERADWNQMRMLRTDLADVTGYTFLVNGQPAASPWHGEFRPGDTVRLRFINAAAMSFFDVRIPGLDMVVVSADGQPVKPVTVQEFRIGTAETYDVLIRPRNDRYVLEAESIDRSGFALALLSNGKEPAAPIAEPQARPRALLTMADMGHGEHSGHDMATMNHAAHNDHHHDEHAHHRMGMNTPVITRIRVMTYQYQAGLMPLRRTAIKCCSTTIYNRCCHNRINDHRHAIW